MSSDLETFHIKSHGICKRQFSNVDLCVVYDEADLPFKDGSGMGPRAAEASSQ